MINWCNHNQGFLMVILTCIYVIATITICFFNYKAIAEQRNISQQQIKFQHSRFATNHICAFFKNCISGALITMIRLSSFSE